MEHYKNLSLENIEGEEWKDISEWDGFYKISSFGRVKSIERIIVGRYGILYKRKTRILRQGVAGGQRAIVGLAKNGQTRTAAVSRLVAFAFIPNPDGKEDVCHKDDNPLNNQYLNLFWGTHLENMQDCTNKGRRAIGERVGNSKLKTSDVLIIRKLLATNHKQKDIANMFGVTSQNISDININKRWKHVQI